MQRLIANDIASLIGYPPSMLQCRQRIDEVELARGCGEQRVRLRNASRQVTRHSQPSYLWKLAQNRLIVLKPGPENISQSRWCRRAGHLCRLHVPNTFLEPCVNQSFACSVSCSEQARDCRIRERFRVSFPCWQFEDRARQRLSGESVGSDQRNG